MQAELNSDRALSAANELLSHLRKNPQAALQPARDLAVMFELDEHFVAQVLAGINANRRAENRPVAPKAGSGWSLSQAIGRLWARAIARPVLFAGVTFLLCFVSMYGATYLTPLLIPKGTNATGIPNQVLATLISILGIGVLTFVLHMVVYFHHRRSRHAVFGGLLLFVGLVAWIVIEAATGNSAKSPGTTNVVTLYIVTIMLLMVLSLMYVGIGSLAAVVGGWARFKLQEREEETMSRQDLLERYFELQTRLQKSAYPRPSNQGPAVFSWPWVIQYRKHQILVNLVLGFVSSVLILICVRASGVSPGQANPELNAWFVPLMFMGIIQFVMYIVQGYLSTTAWRAVLGTACLVAGKTLTAALPIREFSVASLGWGAYFLGQLFDLGLMSAASLGGFLGAVVQNRAAKESSLQRNDQATLLAEMVRIQWMLSNEAASICVLVVDAAKSSEMKADADPLVVEYVFREYQEWIAEICNQRGGRVHSTAGDGAVVAFDTCGLALAAARKIQTDIFVFNKNVNRLSMAFRLRVGLHVGEVVGDINEVQFTEVIDIAAHIEGVSPIGGIAATDEVVQRLAEEQFIDLNHQLDGHQVFMVANPTDYS